MKDLSKCGLCCANDCKAYKIECDGCNELEGKVSWPNIMIKFFVLFMSVPNRRISLPVKSAERHRVKFGYQPETRIFRIKNFRQI